MFQVCTMDGWAEDVVRSLSEDGSVSFTDGKVHPKIVLVPQSNRNAVSFDIG